ncbi:MAG: NYN domain-containing protein [Actinomycetes bacterium]
MPHYSEEQQNELAAAGFDTMMVPDRPAPAELVPVIYLPPARRFPVPAAAPAASRAEGAEGVDDDVVVDLRPAGLRTVHVVDLENLLGRAHRRTTIGEIQSVLAEYRALVGARPDDLFFYGANPKFQLQVALATGSNQVRGYRGRDGADMALLHVVDPDWVVGRFDRVCLASGDHIFAPLARTLKEQGLHVTVVSRPMSVAAELYTAASEHLVLPAQVAVA